MLNYQMINMMICRVFLYLDFLIADCDKSWFDGDYCNISYLVAHPTNRKWVITTVINGISRVNPLITGVITHLLSGMSHQVQHTPLLSIFIDN